jgi:hypothetical protein
LPNLKSLKIIALKHVSLLSKDVNARVWPPGLKARVCQVSGLGWGLNRGHSDRFYSTAPQRVCCFKGHESDSLPRLLSRFYGAIKLFKSNVSFCSQTAWFIHILVYSTGLSEPARYFQITHQRESEQRTKLHQVRLCTGSSYDSWRLISTYI